MYKRPNILMNMRFAKTQKNYLRNVISSFICLASMATMANAQDLHFSQWFNSPLTTNPANTGFIPDADFRIGGSYRSQWVNVLSVPYKTFSIYGDAQLFRDKLDNGWLGVGGVLLRDVAGSGNLTSTKLYGSVAYHQMLGNASLLTAGFNLGWANKRVDPTRLKFPDQFNKATGFFDAGIPSAVDFNTTNVNYLDVQAGLNYAYFPSTNVYVNGGFSIHHLNRPKETFFNATPGFDNRLAPRYIGFVNAAIKLNDMVIVNPMVYYTQQAKANELVAGLNANYNISGNGEIQLIGGAYYRLKDAIIPMIGFQWKDLNMSFTYDATTSGLRSYNGTRGALEFSITKKGLFPTTQKNNRQSWCPSLRQY
jgi:type IX secretion system PorP/SprF family membrane protein